MPAQKTAPPTPSPPSMLDRVRQAGLADELIEAVDRRVRRRKQRRRIARGAVVAMLVAIVVFWFVPSGRDTETIATGPRSRQSLVLVDGSQAELNAHSVVHLDFRHGRRHVRLDRGEVFLDVARDAARPFIVETPAGRVRVTGTRFDVRVVDDTRLEITLLEGGVRVDLRNQTVQLRPGEQLTATPAATAVRTLSPPELADVTAWRRGQLVLDGLSLAEAVARVAAYHDCTIDVADEIAGLRLGGVCPLDDLPQFLAVLRSTKAVEVENGPRGSYRIGPLRGPAPARTQP